MVELTQDEKQYIRECKNDIDSEDKYSFYSENTWSAIEDIGYLLDLIIKQNDIK